MIKADKETRLFSGFCDIPKCTNDEETEIEKSAEDDGGKSFRAAVADLKERGWEHRRENGRWTNVCPSCASEGK